MDRLPLEYDSSTGSTSGFFDLAIESYIAGAQSTQPEQTTLQAELEKMSYGDLICLKSAVYGYTELQEAVASELYSRIQHLIQLTKS